jgi:short-subunit dehydrogenase
VTEAKPLAIVTGPSSGIGRELARQFATHGFDVIVVAEDAELASAADELAGGEAGIQAVRTDLATDQEALMAGRGQVVAGSAENKVQGGPEPTHRSRRPV